jgi:serine O-acetyltransferase
MDSIQIMNIILDAMDESKDFSRSMRADIMAVRDRDPACTCLPDVFLHFKGFHALQSYRVAHHLWNENKKTLAHYMQSQMSQNFQIDIHPKATLLSGIMLDHGTGIVIGETARVGYNCSILHHVTLGGSGKRGVERHPKVGNGVLLGAGSTILGNIVIGGGSQVGAGTLVIEDLPPNSVAVGVPAKIIGSYKAKVQPSQNMDQVGSEASDKHLSTFSMDGI